jgi:hypothetical protein
VRTAGHHLDRLFLAAKVTEAKQSDQREIADAVELIRTVAQMVISKLDPEIQYRAYGAAARAMNALKDSERPSEGTTVVSVYEPVKRHKDDDR